MKYPIEIETEHAFRQQFPEAFEAQSDRKPRQRRWRGLWRWLRALLPLVVFFLFLIARSPAPTVIVDQRGVVITTFPLPRDRTIVVPVVTTNLIQELLSKPTPARGTPQPTVKP